MGLRGPTPKSAEQRIREGERAHRPLPPPAAPKYLPGVPERPRGMSAAARRAWDAYVEQLAPLGVLRAVDGFALRRLCEDVAALEELQKGKRKLASQMRKEAAAEGRTLRGGAIVELSLTSEGRGLNRDINILAARIKRDEIQFGLTPVSSQRLPDAVAPISMPGAAGFPATMDAVETALCV